MIIPKVNNSYLEIKSADWELDFYSRPIIEKNGKKRWELIIASTKNFNFKDTFYWSKICPANKVNSIWLTNALKEAISEAEKQGWGRPEKIRFWRSSMKSIIKKSLENIKIEGLVSRRTYSLFERINFLEKEVYPNEKGYVNGVLAPTFTSQIINDATPLPEAVRGESLAISEISIGELKTAKNWPIQFGDIFPIEESIDDNYLVPGLRLFSENRAIALAAWFSSLEPIKLGIDKNRLLLEALEDDKWLVTDLADKDAELLNRKFKESKTKSFGYQFISIQSNPYIEEFAGFWMLKDIDLIT
tara:strand:- start:49672 stop:50577 length:906 start_codon:yes stop_codon:yes gene_type:complete